MGFWNALFGGTDQSPEEEKKEQEAKNFDLLKYDGVKAMKMGQTDYSIRCFREALKLKDDLETHDYLSLALLRQGELDDALKELQTLSDAEPQNLNILLRMAQVAHMKEDYDKMSPKEKKFFVKAFQGRNRNGNSSYALKVLTNPEASPEDKQAVCSVVQKNPDLYFKRKGGRNPYNRNY